MSAFSYRALTPTQPRIRLITLHPAYSVDSVVEAVSPIVGTNRRAVEFVEIVNCSVFHTSLSDAPDYTALSYTWGGTKTTRKIMLNGAIMEVGSNLELAMRYLRVYGHSVTLWIDALCIDQRNSVEKSEQVQQMRKIYLNAKAVISWLGPDTDDSELAMRWIEDYGARAHALQIGSTPELQLIRLLNVQDSLTPGGNLHNFLEDLREQLMPSTAGHTGTALALQRFFARPYWKRVWVVQEVATASALVLQCGTRTVPEESMHQAMRLLRNFMNYASLYGPRELHMSQISVQNAINMFKARRLKTTLPLSYLLRTFRTQLCSDARDKIFGILGVCSDVEELGIVVDYNKSWQQVFAETARALMSKGVFDMMSWAGLSEDPSLPSWAPDWSYEYVHNSLQQRAAQRKTNPLRIDLQPSFSASGYLTQPSLNIQRTSQSWNAPLVLSAISVAEVISCGSLWRQGGQAIWLDDLLSFATHANGASQRIYDDTLEAALRTAVADQDVRRGNDKPRLSRMQIQELKSLMQDRPLISIVRDDFSKLGISYYDKQLEACATGRRPVMLSNGLIGIAPARTIVGDRVFILLGSTLPCVLRWNIDVKHHHFVGDAYIHGIMNGEFTTNSPTEQIMLV